MSKFYKAQGAFEYMMSYGWAILIVVVLGILLFSLGVLNPVSTPTSAGFTVLRPVSWSFKGGDEHSSNVTIAFANVAGQSLTLWLNDTDSVSGSKQSIKFKKGNSLNCYFNGALGLTAREASGAALNIINNKISVPVGGIITINGTIDGGGVATPDSNCGGITNAGYRYDVQIVAEDEYLVLKKDTGLVTGKFV